MLRLKLATLGLIFAGLAFSTAASAKPMKNGSVYLFMPDGKMKKMRMADKSKIMEMLKDASPMGEEMAIVVWGNQVYVMKNHKMDNGQMAFDYWGFHGNR